MLSKIDRFTWIGLRPTGDLAGFTCYTDARGHAVWFVKSPPKVPFSRLQLRRLRAFEFVARAWNSQTQATRDTWNLAARRCHLYVCGYSLFVHWQLKRDQGTIRTIERNSGLQLLPG